MNKATTRAQRESLWTLFCRVAPESAARYGPKCRAYRSFRRGFVWHFGDFIGGQWCGMFIGIERDGYTHS